MLNNNSESLYKVSTRGNVSHEKYQILILYWITNVYDGELYSKSWLKVDFHSGK